MPRLKPEDRLLPPWVWLIPDSSAKCTADRPDREAACRIFETLAGPEVPDRPDWRAARLELARYPDSSCKSKKLPSTKSARGLTSTSRPLSLALRPLLRLSLLRVPANVSSFLLVTVSFWSVAGCSRSPKEIEE